MRSLLDRVDTRLQFAGHETFPCRYGWLKKSFDAVVEAQGDEEAMRRVFASEQAIADFGVGKNMVASMRHWSIACGILEGTGSGNRIGPLEPTPLGSLIFGGGDPYLERQDSLWLLHWRLASAPGRSTAWYYAFNEFNEPIFSRETMANRLVARVEELREAGRLADSRIARATIVRDVDCLIRTYVSRATRGGGGEDRLECPLAELGLVMPLAGGALQFRRGPKPTLGDAVFAFALIEFWQTAMESRGSLSIETIAHEPGSPGRVFMLDEDAVVERLEAISDASSRALEWDESAGMRQVVARSPIAGIDRPALLSGAFAEVAS